MNFDIDLTATQRQAILDRWNAINSTATTEQLRLLMHDVLMLLLDDPQYTADDRQFSRAIDVTTGKPREPEYAHEFLMTHDTDYFVTWAYDYSDTFRETADASTRLLAAVERGRLKHSYFESDPDIVDRSLLRNNLRPRLEGEEDPPPVLGANAPDEVIAMPIIVQQTAQTSEAGW